MILPEDGTWHAMTGSDAEPVNATTLPDDMQHVGRCNLSAIHLTDVLLMDGFYQRSERQQSSRPRGGGFDPGAPNTCLDTPAQVKGPKVKRKRAKDFVSAHVAGAEVGPSARWLQAWDPHHKMPYFFNTETQESVWRLPANQSFVPDPGAPKSPSEVMDMALARTKDKKAFRAAKRDAENFVGLLLRAKELSEPDVVVAKLDASMDRLRQTLQGLEEHNQESLIPVDSSVSRLTDAVDSAPLGNANQEWDSLQARSTGLMTHIPASTGTHLRFTDPSEPQEEASGVLESSGAVPSSMTAQQSSPLIHDNQPQSPIRQAVDRQAPGEGQQVAAACTSPEVGPDAGTVRNASSLSGEFRGELCDQGQQSKGQAVVGDSLREQQTASTDAGQGHGCPDTDEPTEASLPLKLAAAIIDSPEAMLDTDPIVPGEANSLLEEQLAQDLLRGAQSLGEGRSAHVALQVLSTFEMLKQVRVHKFWHRRFSLWSRFEEGIQMDLEGWYSATPEAIAQHQAKRLACPIAVDAFGGVGGNAVQLAATCQQTLVCDLHYERLLLAKNNAEVYGVAEKMDFICGDFLKMAPHFQADSVFLSPPWGGPSYHRHSGLGYSVKSDIGGMKIGYEKLVQIADSALHTSAFAQPHAPVHSHSPGTLDAKSVASPAFAAKNADVPVPIGRPDESTPATSDGTSAMISMNTEEKNDADQTTQCERQRPGSIACFLPKTTDLLQISACSPGVGSVEVEKNYLNDQLKSITVYHGAAVSQT